MDRLAHCLCSHGQLLLQYPDGITEIRVRVEQPLRLRMLGGNEITGSPVSKDELQLIISRLTEDSFYACERELRHGYFTAAGGCRVGVCGKMNAGDSSVHSVANISSLCIRIPREVYGCAQRILDQMKQNGFAGVLILSAPGLGKTTLLRDLARQISLEGYNVAIADERREIAACRDGIAQMDVGPRTDVLDGCNKSIALPMLLRSCAPDYLVVDEIAGNEDAVALLDAHRCGVHVAATAHADVPEDALARPSIGRLIQAGVFRYVVQLGPRPGEIRSVEEYKNGEKIHAEGNIAVLDTDRKCRCGPHALQRQKTPV